MSVSVAMAVYNGEKYIREQLLSILKQLGPEDEVIISYDKSTDNTEEIIQSFAATDKRIQLVSGPCEGVVANFENAILACKNDYIFLSDQDDVWMNNKVFTVLAEFKRTHADLILHDAIIVNENLEETAVSFFAVRKCKKGIWNNILKNSYIGCCMAFRKEMKQFILPFPHSLPMHDQWIGLIGEKYGTVEFIKDKLIMYRRHNGNVSSDKHLTLKMMLLNRIFLLHDLINKMREVHQNGKNK